LPGSTSEPRRGLPQRRHHYRKLLTQFDNRGGIIGHHAITPSRHQEPKIKAPHRRDDQLHPNMVWKLAAGNTLLKIKRA